MRVALPMVEKLSKELVIREAILRVRANCIGCKVSPSYMRYETEEWAKIHELQIRDAYNELVSRET